MLDPSLFNDQTTLTDYRSGVWRVVESQEDAATLRIVDDLAEQALLEQMLDGAKPKYRVGTEGMHYLLKTAFRYPPLEWGSRFGTRLMPSYFYASEAIKTALCECAYYRFLLMSDMGQPYVESIRSEYCVFKVLLSSEFCLDLASPEFAPARDQLRDPQSYALTHKVGSWAYARSTQNDDPHPVNVIRFESARLEGGVNVAVAEPKSIRSRKPTTQQKWLCLTKPDSVSFSSRESDMSYVFNRREFCDESGEFLRVS